jgi:enamine deaminase RidA (YjgF/YER057c/UK114 family)
VSDARRPSERLRELGIELPAVPVPVAAYVPATRTLGHLLTSGQLPTLSGRLPLTGKVGREVTAEQAVGLARQAALNALAAAAAVAGGVDSIARIVKLVVYVSSDPAFTSQAQVANGASELLLSVFGPEGEHVRSAVGVAVLPLDAPVELELTVEATPASL